MNRERWQRIREVLEAALERPPGERADFLDQACGSDRELRKEIDSLIAHKDEARSFLEDRPVIGMEDPTDDSGSLVGRVFFHYKILEEIGRGGMGEVYVAEDTKLKRRVALKVLPAEVDSADRLKRFEQEARAASALDHPNIVTIHDIAEVEGQHFIVMQYVEGKTLRELMERRKLKLSKALHVAIQIADGLSRAHAHGIVHRDLKPDNVMVTEDGLVKILDFGVAKLLEPSEWTEASTRGREERQTKEGHVVGTAPYMSPEQAQGQKVDARSDIFSFGSVLYEMVTGRRAFSGESVTAILAAIVRDDPEKVSVLLPSVPLDLEKLITRSLRKEPERRFQSMADLRVALQEIKEELDSGSFVSAGQVQKTEPRRGRKIWLWVVAAIAAFAMGVAGWLYFSTPAYPPLSTVPLTSYPGEEGHPALSPDGNLVAFTRRGEAGTYDLYVKQISGGEPLALSSGLGDVSSSAWSPDGQRIAFIRHIDADLGAPNNAVFVIPTLGGAEQQVGTVRMAWGISWSPDDSFLALQDHETHESSSSIYLLSLETGEKRKLTAPPPHVPFGDSNPRFSPDGETLAFERGGAGGSDIYLVSVESRHEQRLTFGNHILAGLDWAPDGKSIVFSANRPSRAEYWLWRVSVSGGEPEPLEVGEQGTSPTVSREGRRLAYVKNIENMNIWRVGGPSAGPEAKSPVRFIASTGDDDGPRYSPDGTRILFTSTRSGYMEIYVCDSDGAKPKQLTLLEHPWTARGRWSPNGEQIAFWSSKEGSADIFIISAMGGPSRRLTTESQRETGQNWSKDGRAIYFASNRTGKTEIWRMPAEGGEAFQITKNGGTSAFESPDGAYLYFTKQNPNEGPPGIWRMPIDGGEEELILEKVRWIDWTPTEKGIFYFNREAEPGATIEFFDFTSGEVSHVAVLEHRPRGWPSVSPDEQWILYVRYEAEESDIMLVENFR